MRNPAAELYRKAVAEAYLGANFPKFQHVSHNTNLEMYVYNEYNIFYRIRY